MILILIGALTVLMILNALGDPPLPPEPPIL